jgi:hypothetical protein
VVVGDAGLEPGAVGTGCLAVVVLVVVLGVAGSLTLCTRGAGSLGTVVVVVTGVVVDVVVETGTVVDAVDVVEVVLVGVVLVGVVLVAGVDGTEPVAGWVPDPSIVTAVKVRGSVGLGSAVARTANIPTALADMTRASAGATS